MAALISGGLRRKTETAPTLYGRDLQDAQEEVFCRMVCDGIAMGVAFARAGYSSKARDAPSNLWNLPRVQERAAAILEARRTTGVVTLPEVTSMLQRVYSGAVNEGEYSAAHNAAFSLARLYGHVTDRATLEVIRRPSRDPDAPAEQALGAWVSSLGPGPSGLYGPGPGPVDDVSYEGSFARLADAPAAPLGPETIEPQPEKINNIKWLEDIKPSPPGPEPSGLEPREREKPNEINELTSIACDMIAPVPGRPENGAPDRPVTGTPIPRAHSGVLGPKSQGVTGHTPTKKKRVPPPRRQVPGLKKRVLKPRIPSAKDLFG